MQVTFQQHRDHRMSWSARCFTLIGSCRLTSILCAEELSRRPSRPVEFENENSAFALVRVVIFRSDVTFGVISIWSMVFASISLFGVFVFAEFVSAAFGYSVRFFKILLTHTTARIPLGMANKDFECLLENENGSTKGKRD
jgi:hypothetical protein